MQLFLVLLVVMWVVVVSGVALLFRAELQSGVRAIVQKMKRGGSVSNSTSASPLKNTTRYLHTNEDVARFVSDLQSLAKGSRSITTIKPALFEGYFASCAISESSGREVRVYLSRRLLTSLTPLQLLSLESVLQRADRRSSVGSAGVGRHAPDYKDLIADGDVDPGPYG